TNVEATMNFKSILVLSAVAFCAACQTVETTKESAVGVNRSQHMMVSADAVNQSADKAYKDVLAQAQKQNALDRDPATVERVKKIASRLIPATGALRPDAPGWKWEMHVLSSKEVNEADRVGVELMARAGYDPHEAVSLWDKMSKLGGSQPPQFLSTHPANASRIADVKQDADKVMSLYQAATKGGSASAGK